MFEAYWLAALSSFGNDNDSNIVMHGHGNGFIPAGRLPGTRLLADNAEQIAAADAEQADSLQPRRQWFHKQTAEQNTNALYALRPWYI